MSIEEVRSLVAERQRYDDWLTALEARRGETPARVYERVHGDYDARRTEVLDKLREHVGALELLGGDLSQQVLDLTVKLDALEDQRVEAMIRNAVGEYDNDRWESLRGEVDREIGKLTDDRALVQMELEEIRELLQQARPSPVAEPEPVVPPAPELAAAATSAAQPAVDAPMIGEQGVPAQDTDFIIDLPSDGVQAGADVPEFSGTTTVDVVGSASVASAPELVPPAPPTLPQFGGDEVDDALAMFAETPAQPMHAVPAPLDGIDVEFDVPDTDIMPVATNPSTSQSAGVVPPVDPFDDLAFLRSVIEPSGSQPVVPATMTPPSLPSAQSPQGEQTKTLRCTECGTMNLPTEWYCERCGGELAAF